MEAIAKITIGGKDAKTLFADVYDEDRQKTLDAVIAELESALKAMQELIKLNANIYLVANIQERNALTGMKIGAFCYVQDASGDSTVQKGYALYLWSGHSWVKSSESESMDTVMRLNGMPQSMPDGVADGGRIIVDIQ